MAKYQLLFTGDTFLSSASGVECFSHSVKELFDSSEFCCVNLETAITESNAKKEKAFNFKRNKKVLSYLTDNNVYIANIANNHTCDYGHAGLMDTLSNLNDTGIKYVGDKTSNECIVTASCGLKIGIAGFTFGFEDELSTINPENIKSKIIELKNKCNYIVCCFHWGEEYVAFPSPYQQKIAHWAIDNGANIIIGHHPHVMQGFEEYKGGMIFYSLGNFNFNVKHPYHNILKETRYGYCVGINIDTKCISSSIIPIAIDDNYVPFVVNDNKSLLEYLTDISKCLSNGELTKFFWLAQASEHHFRNNMPAWKKRISEFGFPHFLLMLKWLISREQLLFLLGLFLSPFYKKIKI